MARFNDSSYVEDFERLIRRIAIEGEPPVPKTIEMKEFELIHKSPLGEMIHKNYLLSRELNFPLAFEILDNKHILNLVVDEHKE